jgi:hypothetical protein
MASGSSSSSHGAGYSSLSLSDLPLSQITSSLMHRQSSSPKCSSLETTMVSEQFSSSRIFGREEKSKEQTLDPHPQNPNPKIKEKRGRVKRQRKSTHRESPRARRQRSAAVRPRPFLSISMRIGKPRHGDEEHHLRREAKSKGRRH